VTLHSSATKRISIAFATIIALLLVGWIGCGYRSTACKQRGAAYAARVEKLERDAHEKLKVGTTKEAVIQFFTDHGIPATFVEGEVTGTVYTTGCSPFGCGSDEALLGLTVKVDKADEVTSEPEVGAIYTNCL
jgi:hypothetical protein